MLLCKRTFQIHYIILKHFEGYFDALKINIFGFYFKIHFDVSLPNPAYDIIFIYCCRMPLMRKGVSLSE